MKAVVYSAYLFFFYSSGDHRDLHSFPTRRSFDLIPARDKSWRGGRRGSGRGAPARARGRRARPPGPSPRASRRSEEHTSELQSRFDLVCRLLLEKKKPHILARLTLIPIQSLSI